MCFIIFTACLFVSCLVNHLFVQTDHEKERRVIRATAFLTKWVLSININHVNASIDNMNSNENGIMIISNHPSIVDAFVIASYHYRMFADRDLIFIAKESVRKIPFIGSYMEKNHLLLSRDIQKDREKMETYLKRLKSTGRTKFVIYLFPEGTTMCPDTLQKSIEFLGGRRPHWTQLLRPKIGALYELLPAVDKIIDLTIRYDGSGMNSSYKDLFLGRYPTDATLVSRDATTLFLPRPSYEDLLRVVERLWDEKEKLLLLNRSPDILGVHDKIAVFLHVYRHSICFMTICFMSMVIEWFHVYLR